jgi:hypothetical protein
MEEHWGIRIKGVLFVVGKRAQILDVMETLEEVSPAVEFNTVTSNGMPRVTKTEDAPLSMERVRVED